MGQGMKRMMAYDRVANERNAISGLQLANSQLKWYRLDDGVMGGQSESFHEILESTSSPLHFKGHINTNGGGFASIRSKIDEEGLPKETKAIQVKLRGDGKTYKFLLSDGNSSTGGPFSRSPVWQIDIPTEKSEDTCSSVTLPLDNFLPSFGPRTVSDSDKKKYQLNPQNVREIGVMLSLKLSNGSPNPVETFGEGKFDFSLKIDSIDLL